MIFYIKNGIQRLTENIIYNKNKMNMYDNFLYSYQSGYRVSYNNGKGNVTIDFNICDYAYRRCPDNTLDFANIINENNTCNHMSS